LTDSIYEGCCVKKLLLLGPNQYFFGRSLYFVYIFIFQKIAKNPKHTPHIKIFTKVFSQDLKCNTFDEVFLGCTGIKKNQGIMEKSGKIYFLENIREKSGNWAKNTGIFPKL